MAYVHTLAATHSVALLLIKRRKFCPFASTYYASLAKKVFCYIWTAKSDKIELKAFVIYIRIELKMKLRCRTLWSSVRTIIIKIDFAYVKSTKRGSKKLPSSDKRML